MAQPLSRPLVLSSSSPWPPAPPSPRFPNWPLPRPGSQRMPRSESQPRPPLQSKSQSLWLSWPPTPPLPLFHLLSQIPAQPLSQPHSQCLLKPGAQILPLPQSPLQPLLPSHSLPLFKPQCPAQPNPLSQPLPSSLCLPKSFPLPTPFSHTLPLSQPRLRSGLQLPPALLLLLLFSVLGPGAGGLFLTDYSTCSPRKLSPFRSFASTELFHFHVPEDTFLAVWNLIIFKEQGGTFGDHCPDQSVTVYFRSGAPPVINPLHTHFPGDTAVPGVFSLTLSWTLPNRTSGIFNVSSPLPGDWFLAAHLPQAHGHISVKVIYAPGTTFERYKRHTVKRSPGRVSVPSSATADYPAFAGRCCAGAWPSLRANPLGPQSFSTVQHFPHFGVPLTFSPVLSYPNLPFAQGLCAQLYLQGFSTAGMCGEPRGIGLPPDVAPTS
ncbi:transmembrane protein 8B isoform X8 [Mustela erminea]|uniref:transmembrane protein 8B isoform X8 n=1 Tax=Mustela erminea TaxID=36723 RepID=UPI0013866319|nr:transmembrane protein 8B isoform X8 [Mustela erminea]